MNTEFPLLALFSSPPFTLHLLQPNAPYAPITPPQEFMGWISWTFSTLYLLELSGILDRVDHLLLLEIIPLSVSEPEMYLFSSCLFGSSLKITTTSLFPKRSYILSLDTLIPLQGMTEHPTGDSHVCISSSDLSSGLQICISKSPDGQLLLEVSKAPQTQYDQNRIHLVTPNSISEPSIQLANQNPKHHARSLFLLAYVISWMMAPKDAQVLFSGTLSAKKGHGRLITLRELKYLKPQSRKIILDYQGP